MKRPFFWYQDFWPYDLDLELWPSFWETLTWAILIDCLGFYVPLKNISLIWRRHHYRWRAAKCSPYARRSGPLSREGSLSCHTCCDTGPRFFRSHPKDRPIQSPLTTHKGMWRIYSNPDPHGEPGLYLLNQMCYRFDIGHLLVPRYNHM
jgi:hypothetical protein